MAKYIEMFCHLKDADVVHEGHDSVRSHWAVIEIFDIKGEKM